MRRQLVPVSATTSATATAITPISAATSTALHLGTGFVDVQRPSPELSAVQGGNRFVSFFGVGHLYKTEPARAAGVTIGHDANPVDLSVRLEHPPQFFFRCVEVEVPNENILQASCL
jgi:hypothetical protein